jgi:hypothetical protein
VAAVVVVEGAVMEVLHCCFAADTSRLSGYLEIRKELQLCALYIHAHISTPTLWRN